MCKSNKNTKNLQVININTNTFTYYNNNDNNKHKIKQEHCTSQLCKLM